MRHTLRRQEHLASLGLPIAERSVLELGAGIGDHTTFFIDRDCPLCVTDGRPELYEILRDRFSWMRTAQIDLDEEPDFSDPYEIVYAYGLLYHLNDPERALRTMSRLCSGMLLLETCVSPKTDLSINLVKEDDLPSQARSGTGCRPSRRWVFETLKTLFPYVYVTRTQPWHPEFPLDWRGLEHGKGLTRSVFVASREPLDLPTLLAELPDVQVRH
ncbi:hypothetical protein BHK69_07845 [Bosea vaviloviae]|uniref:Methyltransferase domain-containing protein n=1 Tax=Bosea vaviloviae TaxID=1526658 RepID=A0A1D7UA75_9HYPH|nr:hypothetical protein BHK69_07845 [Bosea vaviloviae]